MEKAILSWFPFVRRKNIVFRTWLPLGPFQDFLVFPIETFVLGIQAVIHIGTSYSNEQSFLALTVHRADSLKLVIFNASFICCPSSSD